MYLDPMRIALSGDKLKAQAHIRTARGLAFSLAQMTMNGGATSGAIEREFPDGTKITVTKAGNIVSAVIDASGGVLPVETTLAYVTTKTVENYPAVMIVDVAAEKILRTVTLPTFVGYNIDAMTISDNGQHVFVALAFSYVVRIDLVENTASGINYDLTNGASYAIMPRIFDLFMAPDDARLYANVTAAGTPSGAGGSGPGGQYGFVMSIDVDTFDVLGANPNMQLSNRSYYGSAHPVETDLIYIPVFGDADDDYEHPSPSPDTNNVPESIRVAAWNGVGYTQGDVYFPFYLASGSGPKEVAITPNGERALATNTRATSFVSGGGSIDCPTLVVYDSTDGALTRLQDLYMGAQLTGSLACTDTHAVVIERVTGVARVLARDPDSGDFAEATTFRCVPDDVTPDNGADRRLAFGPRKGLTPDPLFYVVCTNGQCLTACTVAGKIKHTVRFGTVPGILAVGRVRKFERMEKTA